MSTTYLCKKCKFNTGHYTDLKKHLCKKKQCSKNLESIGYSDDQLFILSLLPYINNKHIVESQEIEYLRESSEILKNKDKLFNVLENVDKNKIKKCCFCNLEFSKIIDLRKHIIILCFQKELEKENKIIETIINGNNNLLNSNGNIINNTTINTTQNITNIYLEVKTPAPTPIPFDEDWDISNIDNKTRTSVLMSKFMYTTLLEEILKNELNLNVIIDKNNDVGIVYKNDIDKYINMKSKDIVSNTMDKLNKHLNELNKADNLCFESVIDFSRKMIRKKHIDFIKDPNINNGVNYCVTNIYSDKKNDAIKMSENVKNKIIDPKKGY